MEVKVQFEFLCILSVQQDSNASTDLTFAAFH